MSYTYNGVMRIINGLAPGALRLDKHIVDISHEAAMRLKWFDYYEAHERNARKTCRHHGISPDTFYFWKKRYRPDDLTTLEERPHRPKHVRQPTWTAEASQAVLGLREKYPGWGKAKLANLLADQGRNVSVSMVGRILRSLKDRGVLREPVRNHISAKKRLQNRPYAVRKPKEYVARNPGDVVEVDTMDVRPLPGVIIKHFGARDIVSKWDVIETSSRATASSASRFISTIVTRMPFKVKAIQVDGGSEFQSVFEETCQKLGIRLFVLPPRSPKLNGCIERANRTHTEEFYEFTDCDFDIQSLNKALYDWEIVYNTVRPHQALDYLTPSKYLLHNYSMNGKEKVYGIT
jgi:transposase InsO family protein